jgi:molybdopterin converting factor subunit 1
MPATDTITVHLFAAAAERVNAPSITVPHPPTVAALRRLLTDTKPSLADLLPRCAVAVNHEYAADDHPISPGDEVAIIPPVSGG